MKTLFLLCFATFCFKTRTNEEHVSMREFLQKTRSELQNDVKTELDARSALAATAAAMVVVLQSIMHNPMSAMKILMLLVTLTWTTSSQTTPVSGTAPSRRAWPKPRGARRRARGLVHKFGPTISRARFEPEGGAPIAS